MLARIKLSSRIYARNPKFFRFILGPIWLARYDFLEGGFKELAKTLVFALIVALSLEFICSELGFAHPFVAAAIVSYFFWAMALEWFFWPPTNQTPSLIAYVTMWLLGLALFLIGAHLELVSKVSFWQRILNWLRRDFIGSL